MGKMTIEDGFEYNLKRVAQRFIADFENKNDAIKGIKDGDHVETFIGYLWERANEYMDIDQLIIDEVNDE